MTRIRRAIRDYRVVLLVAAATAMVPSAPEMRAQSAADSATTQPRNAVPLPGVDTLLDKRVKAVSSRLRCPVCQGESIQDSPAELSAQMRTLVREQLATGKSEREVLDYFTQKYGQWILLEPKAEGFNLLVYWLPVVFIVMGGVGIAIAVRRWTRPDRQIVATDLLSTTDLTDAP